LDQVGAVDIFIGIMWQRFGTPTGVAGSGTEEEFNSALANWEQTRRPRILCYFSRVQISPPASVEAAEQLLKVAQFRKRVEAAGLICTYDSDMEFKEKLREHLQQVLIQEFAGRTPPLERNLLALLEIEKQRCKHGNVAYHTPNLLFSLLSAPTGIARRMLEQVCPDKAADIVERLRAYTPAAPDLTPFSEFDWYSRRDVQAAREFALQEGDSAIGARHLFRGFLKVPSETQRELARSLEDEAFAELCKLAESAGLTPNTTPSMRGWLS
jgi:hypothetical protein